MSVFNTSTKTKKDYMFFGKPLNVSRFDVQKFPIFQKLINKQLGNFWRPEEIALDKDARDFKSLSEHQKHIFTSNLFYQTTLDSINSRGPSLAFIPWVSLPELETCIEIWSMFEALHSLSYAYILKNVYPNPTEGFDKIILTPEIMERARRPIKYYDDFINAANDYKVNGSKNISLRDLKEKFLLCIVSVNMLEGLNFYASFACTYAFAEQGLMEGNAKIISLIHNDEHLHLAITQNILRKWINGEDDPEMKKIFEKNIDKIKIIFQEVVDQEKAWAKYLFKDGSMLGLNEKILNDYVEYVAGRRMKTLGIKHNYSTVNPLSWVDKYTKRGEAQLANQEVERVAYVIGGVKNDINVGNFDDLKF